MVEHMYGVNKMQLRSFENAHLLTGDLASQLAKILTHAIAKRDHAYLVVSGGKTPVELFKALAKIDIPWHKVTVTLADERCVPSDDMNRNENMVRTLLLQHHAARANFLSLYNASDNKLQSIEAQIAALPAFDAVVLGMGEDGHTASLFPCAAELSMGLAEDAKAVLFTQPTTAPYQRVSLSKKRLLNSRAIFFHLVGQTKLTTLHQAMRQADPMVMPVSAFLNNHHPNVHVMYAP